MNAISHPEGMGAYLFDLVQAPIRWHVVRAALVLKLFDDLGETVAAEAIAAAHGLDAGRTALLLDALVAMGVLDKSPDGYRLNAAAAPYLSGENSLARSLLQLGGLRQTGLERLPETLREGVLPPRPGLDFDDARFWEGAVASLRSFHRALGCPAMLAILESLPEWPRARRFLDIGAGSEVLCRAVAERRPDIAVTLFDLPPCAARIGTDLASMERVEPISIRSGDYNADDLGGDYDVIWASMTLYYARDLVAVLARIRRALAPGGVFVSLHEGLTGDRTAPEGHVVGRLVPALRGQDLSFEHGEIRTALEQAGFGAVDSRSIDTAFGPMDVDIAREG